MTGAKPTLKLVVPGNLVDEFGDLVAQRDAFAPTEREYQKLYGQLKALVADADPEAAFVCRGERFTLTISARSFESKPDIPAVRKKLGAATFLLVASVTKKALEGWLLKPVIEELCVTTQTGSRSFGSSSDCEPSRKP